MATDTLTERAPQPPGSSGVDRWLGHPVAYILTAAILLMIFGWTFFTNADRVAPTKDPAYYTWRTEALLSEDAQTLLEIEGPRYEGGGGMYSGGYRVSAPVLGGLLRRVADVAPLSTTAFLMVSVPVMTALLLAAFAYQHRKDPLIFHGVAFGVASLYLTPPFVGYLDNLLALFFLAGGLLFLRDAPNSWPARLGLGFFLLMVGFTHPTTLVIFFLTLGAMAFVRWIYRKFDLKSVIRDDGPVLLTAFASIVVTYVLWKIGIWGASASLGDAALLPPYESSFFVDRLVLWVEAMRPAVNGPLFLIGAVALVMAGRRAAEDDLARVALIWLAPLVGIFGFLAGKSYPYYRFFNTTLAWVLLVGVGIWLAARFFIGLARRGGVYNLAWLGVLALVLVIFTNFRSGLEVSGWNNAQGGWLSAAEREELDLLRVALDAEGDPRPVIFVVDTEDTSPRSYGYTKLSGNTSRYGLPPGWIDEAYLYLGSLEELVAGGPTSVGEETYDAVSDATFTEAEEALEDEREPIIVVMTAFNETGSNAELVSSEEISQDDVGGSDFEVWVGTSDAIVQVEGSVTSNFTSSAPDEESPGFVHVLRVIFGLLLLAVPGSLAARWLLRDASFPEWLAAAPALGVSIVTLVTIGVISVTRSPLSSGVAWIALGISIVATAIMAWRSNPPPPDPAS